jgi:hypothetical protein|tara:strand:+ start:1212 stop:1427 length:216 start_codon:yes stop_codon:yes gene_type:complete
VGIIEPDGILYGSKIKDLIIKTINKIGKIDFEKLNISNSIPWLDLIVPIKATMPVKKVIIISNRVKSIIIF